MSPGTSGHLRVCCAGYNNYQEQTGNPKNQRVSVKMRLHGASNLKCAEKCVDSDVGIVGHLHSKIVIDGNQGRDRLMIQLGALVSPATRMVVKLRREVRTRSVRRLTFELSCPRRQVL